MGSGPGVFGYQDHDEWMKGGSQMMGPSFQSVVYTGGILPQSPQSVVPKQGG